MSKHKTLPQLRRRLLKAAEIMVQGRLSETTRRCGNPGCICQRDPSQRHGPHLYLTYQSEGKNRALYVPAKHVEDARQAHAARSEEHTSELQSPCNLVCRLLLEKKKNKTLCTSFYLLISSRLCFALRASIQDTCMQLFHVLVIYLSLTCIYLTALMINTPTKISN